MAGTLGTAILGNTLLDVLSTQDCNVATFGNQSSNLLIRIYDSNLPFAGKNYVIGLCNIDTTYQRNALYISANQSNMTRIGIGTAFPASIMEIEGVDAIRVPYGRTVDRPTVAKKGQIRYNTELDYFEGYGTGNSWSAIGSGSGGGSTWAVITSNVPGFVLSSGTFTPSCNVALKRFGNNDMGIQLYLKGQVAVKPTGSADYRINLPEALDITSYPVPMILGEMWLLTSNTSTGAVAEYKALAKSIPGDSSFITVKYMNGTTETSLGDFNVGMNLTLHGLVTYKAAVVYNPPRYDSNNVLISGTNVTWTNSLYPYPYLTAPTGGSLTMTYRQGSYRYFGDDIIHNVYVQATLNSQPGDVSLNHTLALEWPVNLTRYTSNTIVGDLWVKVTNGGTFTSYKAYAQTSTTNSNVVTLRYVNGTYDLSLASIAAGSAITIQGTMTYKTVAAASLFIPTQYLPNKLYQDGDGKVALNNDGAIVRARWEVIETSNNPAMIIDQRSSGDVLQFRSNETEIVTVINARGNVGIGTSLAPHPVTVWGGMMFNGTMYDTYGNPLWIPGSSVDWKATPSLPVISVPTGGTWVQNNTVTQGLWRYIGNEVNLNVAVTGTMTVAPTDPTADFKLSLPAPIKLSAYTSNVILGELWANVVFGASSNLFKSFATVDMANSNQVALRILSGTTDTSFSTMSAPSLLTIRGQINYTTTSNILAISVPSTAIPVNFTKDQQGRVALNSANPPRAQLDIVMSNASPALIVDQQSSADIAQFMKSGVVVNAMDTNGNIGIGTATPQQKLVVEGGNARIQGYISASNMVMFRNRIINGDMRLQADGIQGVSGSNTMTVSSMPNWTISTGLFSPSITTQQIALTGNDQATTEQSYAVEIRPANMPLGLAAHFPFEESLRDASGNGVQMASTGSIMYVPGRVGSNALYLANEATVTTATHAANYVSITPFTKSTNTSFSLWVYFTKMPTSSLGTASTIMSIGSTSAYVMGITAYYSSTTASLLQIQNAAAANSTSTTININTWYHIVFTYIPSNSFNLYVNGTYIGNTTASIPASLASGGMLMLGDIINSAYTSYSFAGYIDDLRIYDRLLSTTEISALYNQTPFAPILPSTSGLPHYYPFDNSLSNVGTAGGAMTSSPTAVSYAPGALVGTQCLYLANEARVLASPLAATYYATGTYTFPTTFTVSLWVMYTKIISGCSSVSFITNSATTSLTNSVYIALNSTANGLNVGFIGGNYLTTDVPTVQTWYHYSLTYNSGTLFFYINGNFIRSTTGTLAQNGFMLGNSATTTLLPFAGYIDDLRIYNSVLTPEQVAAVYYTTKSTYTNFQQTIDAGAMADFKWGTNGAIPVTLTTWLKNNTLSPQSFSLSVNSTGLIAHVTFENSYLDTIGEGFLTAPRVLASTTFSNSTYKVGSYALDTTANTVGSAPVARVAYTIPSVIPLPLTFSLWMQAPVTAGAASQYFFTVGSQTTWAVELFLTTSGFLSSGLSIGTTNNNGTYSLALSTNTWYHICMVITPADKYIVYLNGVAVILVSHPVSQLTPAAYSTYVGPIDVLRLGSGYQDGSTPFDGYLDDFRIYNRALTSAQVKALYDANASSTTQPTATNIVIPVRNFTYNTPSIPSNSWQKIQVILPADSTGAWDNRPGQPGARLSLCLGAGSSYSNVSTETWTNNTEYIGGNTQRIHYDSNYFLMASSNSLWMTGVQLEKGNMGTPFDVRPYAIDKRLLFNEPPMCSVYLTVNKDDGVFSLVQFTGINYNPGGYYKLSGADAYHFVCPVTGPYLCTLCALGNVLAYAKFMVNNQAKVPGLYVNGGDYATASTTLILYCNERDRIAVHSQTMEGGGTNGYSGMTISYIG